MSYKGGANSSAKAEVETAEEVEGVVEEEGVEVVDLKERMLLQRILMQNWMLTMKWYENFPCISSNMKSSFSSE